jgi:exopolyphosphatase/guanosine-5'-triphosphate,3'-diphosphate pyrophosphatase
MSLSNQDVVLGAIDVGTNSIKLELARPLADGSLETILQQRDPVRPGDGVFRTGAIPRPVADRMLSTLRRYGALCRRFRARVRAVATSAVREARNKAEVIRRVREEAGINLEVVSGREEARLACIGMLQGTAAHSRTLCVDVGGGSTEVASAVGERPINLWSVTLGAVRLTELFNTAGDTSMRQLRLMREYALDALEARIPRRINGRPRNALGSSGTVKAAVTFASDDGQLYASTDQLSEAIRELVKMGPKERGRYFEPRRADIIIAGAVILEALGRHLQLDSITAVEKGLRSGILIDLLRRRAPSPSDRSTLEAATALGRRFQFDEAHGLQVARLAVSLFDQIPTVHRAAASSRPLLELAAVLHDIGNAVSYNRHHRHTYYLIGNADLPGLSERERELVACVARYHRRAMPELDHPELAAFSPSEVLMIRRLAMLLRIADSLDRSHHQPVRSIQAEARPRVVAVRLKTRSHVDLELWDVVREADMFEEVFRRKLVVRVGAS